MRALLCLHHMDQRKALEGTEEVAILNPKKSSHQTLTMALGCQPLAL